MIPYDTYFNVTTVNLYHRAITMETFFTTIVNQVYYIYIAGLGSRASVAGKPQENQHFTNLKISWKSLV